MSINPGSIAFNLESSTPNNSSYSSLNIDQNKQQLIDKLIFSASLDDPDKIELANILSEMESDKLSLLNKIFLPIFTSSVTNENRLEIMKALKGISFDLWETIGKQIQFLMPYGSLGEDIEGISAYLCEIKTDSFRELFVRVAQQLFDWNMTSSDRMTICSCLIDADALKLSGINSLSLEEKKNTAKFFIRSVGALLVDYNREPLAEK